MTARLGVFVGILVLVRILIPCAGWCSDTLPSPAGCSWVRQPQQGCPVNDARGYQEWVKRNGPVTARHEKSGIELVWVPGGSFMMGSDNRDNDENPVHRVRLDGFWIGKTEVTLGQWRRAAESPRTPYNDQGDDHPVLDVSWEGCVQFCRRAGLELPTEAQWEYAARGPDVRAYPWGDRWDSSLCQSDTDRHGYTRTAPAGSFPGGASWCGALDMAGNVWEWCRDWYQSDFYGTSAARARNPECRDRGSGWRVLRGGSWGYPSRYCRSANRYKSYPDYRFSFRGFRVALPR